MRIKPKTKSTIQMDESMKAKLTKSTISLMGWGKFSSPTRVHTREIGMKEKCTAKVLSNGLMGQSTMEIIYLEKNMVF